MDHSEREKLLEQARRLAGFTPDNPPRSLVDIRAVARAMKTLQEARR